MHLLCPTSMHHASRLPQPCPFTARTEAIVYFTFEQALGVLCGLVHYRLACLRKPHHRPQPSQTGIPTRSESREYPWDLGGALILAAARFVRRIMAGTEFISARCLAVSMQVAFVRRRRRLSSSQWFSSSSSWHARWGGNCAQERCAGDEATRCLTYVFVLCEVADGAHGANLRGGAVAAQKVP